MKRIALSLLAVGLLVSPVLAAGTATPAAPVHKATATTAKTPEAAKTTPTKTASRTTHRHHKRHAAVAKPKASPAPATK